MRITKLTETARYRVTDPAGVVALETNDEREAWMSADACGGTIFDARERVTGRARGGHPASAWIEWNHGKYTTSTMPFYDGSGWLGT